jgi:hypothetical protein
MLDKLFMDITLLAACYAYVLVVIVVSGKTFKLFGSSDKYSRKFLHIMIGNLPFIIPFFTKFLPAELPLLCRSPIRNNYFLGYSLLVQPHFRGET